MTCFPSGAAVWIRHPAPHFYQWYHMADETPKADINTLRGLFDERRDVLRVMVHTYPDGRQDVVLRMDGTYPRPDSFVVREAGAQTAAGMVTYWSKYLSDVLGFDVPVEGQR